MIIKITMKKVREEKGISLRELEEETGIERDYLKDIEENKVSADEILFAEMVVISRALACSTEDLFETEMLKIEGLGEF